MKHEEAREPSLCFPCASNVVQTALANNLKVYDYLMYLFKEMPNADLNNHPERMDQFVPWSKELPANCYKSKTEKR